MVDLTALAHTLREGLLGGAAVDVYPTEPERNGDDFVTGAALRGSLQGVCQMYSATVHLQHYSNPSLRPVNG